MSSKPSLMRIVAAFAAAVLTIAAVTTASLRSLSARRDGSRWVVLAHDVLLAIARVLALAMDAETRQRGYLLTGREEDAETFRAAQSALSQEVDVLALLTQDNPRQQQRLLSLRTLLQRRAEELTRAADLRRQEDRAALDPLESREAIQRTESVRSVGQQMGDEETALLAQAVATPDARGPLVPRGDAGRRRSAPHPCGNGGPCRPW